MIRFKINNIKFVNNSVYNAFAQKRPSSRTGVQVSCVDGHSQLLHTKVGLIAPYSDKAIRQYKQLIALEKLFNMPIFTTDFR